MIPANRRARATIAFYHTAPLLARRAQHGDPEMAWHKMDAFDAVRAGVLAAEEIEAVRGRMPEHVFRELYMAEASDDEGNPFGIDHIRACVQPKTDGRPYVWGWDLAKRRDWTVGIALDRQGRWVDFHRFQKPWGETVKTYDHPYPACSMVGGVTSARSA